MSPRPAVGRYCSVGKLVSFTVLLVVLAVQLLVHPLHDPLVLPQDPDPIFSEESASLGINSPACANPLAFPDQLSICRLHEMSLLQAAKSVAAEFEYGTAALNKGVKEFIREMG